MSLPKITYEELMTELEKHSRPSYELTPEQEKALIDAREKYQVSYAKIAEVFTLTKKSLNEFNLSVDLDKFFPTYKKDNNIHYKLVDDIWDSVEPVYNVNRYDDKSPVKDQQIEEMTIGVNNVIVSFCASIQSNINDIYRDDDE